MNSKIMSGRGACGKIGYLTRNDAKVAGHNACRYRALPIQSGLPSD